ncbi:MAG: hypothetical protein AAF519_04560 [Bacteroidota bacterium]
MKPIALIIRTTVISGSTPQQSIFSNGSRGRSGEKGQEVIDLVDRDKVAGTRSTIFNSRHMSSSNERRLPLEEDPFSGKTNKNDFVSAREGDELSWTGVSRVHRTWTGLRLLVETKC